ncbi:MAG: GNAT family N-acetyltransferase, partial [Clostridia bacterium]|nr:GNAT family N-acetyltransferase [Clostridia bacterium]
MNYTYRQTETSELDEIMNIYVAAQQFMQKNGNPQWPAGFPDRLDVTGGILGGVLYTVRSGGEIAAVFSAVNYDGDYDGIEGEWLTRGNYLAVHRVAVADKFRGKGAGKYILDTAAVDIAKKRGRGSIRMDTHEKNAHMRGLIKGRGFTECGIIRLMRDGSPR